MTNLFKGFGWTLLLAAVLLTAAWGLIELAAYLWKVLHSMSPLAGVAWMWACVAAGLGGLDKAATMVGR